MSCRYLHGLDLIKYPGTKEQKKENIHHAHSIEVPVDILTKIIKDAQNKKENAKDADNENKKLERQENEYLNVKARNEKKYSDLTDMVNAYGEIMEQPKKMRYDSPAWFD